MTRIVIRRNGGATAAPPTPVKGRRPWKKDAAKLDPPDPNRRPHGDHAIRMEGWMDMVDLCLTRNLRTDWEDSFITSIFHQLEAGRELSDKQATQLERIYGREVGADSD